MLMFVLFSAGVSAQDSKKSVKAAPITHMDQFLATLTSSGNDQLAQRVKTLIKTPQPSVYVTPGNSVERGGGVPVSLYVDAKTMTTPGALDLSHVNKSKVELVTIKINNAQDMNGGIDLSVFNDFPSLKYVYILAEYVTTEQGIIASVENNNPQYTVFYNVLKAN
ncbi:MAG: hypothetical protein EOO51_14775 [Flavobacterium sp.]|nr:MAG: hypothetical protein EOO51_14775 [Flavobacterium sp.]